MKRGGAPTAAVLAAFRADGDLRALSGGQGETWQAGAVVLKPAYGEPESRWRAEVLASLPESAVFRVARPVSAVDGSWVVDGWEAAAAVPGHEDPSRLDDVLAAGVAFHRAIAGIPRPAFLALRDNPWAYGDRVAWEEEPVAGSTSTMELLVPLAEARRPVSSPAQLVHGDLLGNVLFSPGFRPAVIDWSPYWRPPAWALAVAVVDALCWYGASADAIDRWSSQPEWGQMLVRALMFRIATREAAFGTDGPKHEPNSAYRPVIDLAIATATRSS